MILTIDVGNSNIVFGLFEKDILKSHVRVETKNPFDEALREFANHYSIKHILISSVVPSINEEMKTLCFNLFNCIPIFIGSEMTALVNLKIDEHHEMGGDLVCGLVGASIKYPVPCILIDCGTATKFMYLDGNKKFHGGSVALGIEKSLNALIGHTELLPELTLSVPKSLISIDTVTAIQSGIVLGHIKMIEGMIESIKDQYGEAFVVLTGGLGNVLNGHIKNVDVFDDHLLLYGLNAMYHELYDKI
ncbi:MAG: type III pantothenate kinase [Turicibacter sp.]